MWSKRCGTLFLSIPRSAADEWLRGRRVAAYTLAARVCDHHDIEPRIDLPNPTAVAFTWSDEAFLAAVLVAGLL